MMRAGLPFGFGIADALDESNDVAVLFSTSDNDYSSFDIVVIADAHLLKRPVYGHFEF